MSIVKNVSDSYKKSPVKFIAVALLVLVGLIFAWRVVLPLAIVVFFWKKFKKDELSNKGTKKKCPHCKTEIDWEASRCPNCHGKIYVWDSGKKMLVTVLILLFFIGIFNMGSSTPSTPSAPSVAETQAPAANSVSSEQAQKELTDLMNLSKKAGLVTSYEFSDSANVVFVGSIWYTQTVQFKKDFIAKIGTLKKAITGYTHFEVRDAYSNEKVGELTAFSQSIEVYK